MGYCFACEERGKRRGAAMSPRECLNRLAAVRVEKPIQGVSRQLDVERLDAQGALQLDVRRGL